MKKMKNIKKNHNLLPPEETLLRQEHAVELWTTTRLTLRDVGNKVGLTYERVRQILKLRGLDTSCSGRKSQKRLQQQTEKNNKLELLTEKVETLRKSGYTPEEIYRRLRISSDQYQRCTKRFKDQRFRGRRRLKLDNDTGSVWYYCVECKTFFPVSEFAIYNQRPFSLCRKCQSSVSVRWQKLNRDKVNSYHRKWQMARRNSEVAEASSNA